MYSPLGTPHCGPAALRAASSGPSYFLMDLASSAYSAETFLM